MIPVQIDVIDILQPFHGYLMQGLQPRDLPRLGIDHLTLDPKRRFFPWSPSLDERGEDILPNDAHFRSTLLIDPAVRDEVRGGVDGTLEAGLSGFFGIGYRVGCGVG